MSTEYALGFLAVVASVASALAQKPSCPTTSPWLSLLNVLATNVDILVRIVTGDPSLLDDALVVLHTAVSIATKLIACTGSASPSETSPVTPAAGVCVLDFEQACMSTQQYLALAVSAVAECASFLDETSVSHGDARDVLDDDGGDCSVAFDEMLRQAIAEFGSSAFASHARPAGSSGPHPARLRHNTLTKRSSDTAKAKARDDAGGEAARAAKAKARDDAGGEAARAAKAKARDDAEESHRERRRLQREAARERLRHEMLADQSDQVLLRPPRRKRGETKQPKKFATAGQGSAIDKDHYRRQERIAAAKKAMNSTASLRRVARTASAAKQNKVARSQQARTQ